MSYNVIIDHHRPPDRVGDRVVPAMWQLNEICVELWCCCGAYTNINDCATVVIAVIYKRECNKSVLINA